MKMKLTLLILVFLIGMSVSRAQQQEKSMAINIHYLLYVPKELPPDGLYPLMLYLHGSGHRGNNLNVLKEVGPPSFLDEKSDFPFVVVSPQCPGNRYWITADLLDLLDHIEATLPIDKNRIYVTGLSMGGFGTWNLAMAAPERFAAIAPICGGGDLDNICVIRDVPVWAFHGKKDPDVPYQESERLIRKLQEYGSDAKLTLYPDAGHDAWSETYENKDLYTWLLSKSKNVRLPDEKILKSYCGRYKYSDKDTMQVIYKYNYLYIKSSEANSGLLLTPVTDAKFNIRGSISGESELYFRRSKDGKIDGFTLGRCDLTCYTKIN
jgi:pimeloyl-ACP methyl ester carboxylesterase